jgi:hypothetical protein
MLGLDEFLDLCIAVNREAEAQAEAIAVIRRCDESSSVFLSRIRDALAKSDARELRAAFEDLASIICEWENEACLSPRRVDVRQILEDAAERIDRMASLFDDSEMCSEPLTPVSTTPEDIRRKLRSAVDHWCRRALEEDADPERILGHANKVMQDVEFLIEIDAFVRHPLIFDRSILDAKLPPPSLQESPKTEVARILRRIREHWVPDLTTILSPSAMRALSEGIRDCVAELLPPHRGSHRLSCALGFLTGHELCAVGAARWFELYRGWKPSHHNPEAQRLCAILWRMAGFGILPGHEGGNATDQAWDGPLRFKWANKRMDALTYGNTLAANILRRNGVPVALPAE